MYNRRYFLRALLDKTFEAQTKIRRKRDGILRNRDGAR